MAPFRIYAEFELPDNVVKEGDTTTMTLPIGFNTSPPDHFDIKDADDNLIAKATMHNENPAKIVLTFTKYVETHSGVKGKFYFNASVNRETQTGSGELPVTLTVNGKIIPGGHVDYNPPQFTSQQLTKVGWMMSDKTKGRYDISLNQNNVVLTNAKFIDTIQSSSVEFDENSIQIFQGQWENKITVMNFLNKKDVTQEFKDAGKIKFEGKKLTIDIGSIGAENINRGFQILYEVKLKYDPLTGEEIKNKAEFTNGAAKDESNGNYKIIDAGGVGEGYVFKIRVLKTGENNKPLAGAKFDVIRVRNNAKVGEITTGQDGSGEIGKLLRDEYRLVETEAPQGYQKLTEPITVNPADFGSDKITLKNIKNEPEAKEKVSGEKTWDDNNDQDGKRPEKITVELYKKVGDKQSEKVTTQEVKADKDGNWKYKFENLPKYEGGKEIKYSVKEVAVEGYTTEIKDFNITNKHVPEKTSVEGTKTWDDANNQDGKRPTKIKVILNKKVGGGQPSKVAEKEVTQADGWKWKFENLDKYEKGQKIEYVVTEEPVKDYTTEINKVEKEDGRVEFNIINKHIPEKVLVSGTKTWIDNNNAAGKRPGSIKVILNKTVDGKTTKVAEKEVTAKDNWNYAFNDLPKYENGKEIKYSIDEVDVPGYKKTIKGHNLENKYIPPKPKLPKTGSAPSEVGGLGVLGLLAGYVLIRRKNKAN